MNPKCPACFPAKDAHLCAVHRKAYASRDLLQETYDVCQVRVRDFMEGRPPSAETLAELLVRMSQFLGKLNEEESKEWRG